MLEKSHIYDEIDRYLRGEMSTEESNAFEKELATNQELRARLHIVEDVKEGLHRRAEKLEKIQSWKETEVNGQSKIELVFLPLQHPQQLLAKPSGKADKK